MNKLNDEAVHKISIFIEDLRELKEEMLAKKNVTISDEVAEEMRELRDQMNKIYDPYAVLGGLGDSSMTDIQKIVMEQGHDKRSVRSLEEKVGLIEEFLRHEYGDDWEELH